MLVRMWFINIGVRKKKKNNRFFALVKYRDPIPVRFCRKLNPFGLGGVECGSAEYAWYFLGVQIKLDPSSDCWNLLWAELFGLWNEIIPHSWNKPQKGKTWLNVGQIVMHQFTPISRFPIISLSRLSARYDWVKVVRGSQSSAVLRYARGRSSSRRKSEVAS